MKEYYLRNKKKILPAVLIIVIIFMWIFSVWQEKRTLDRVFHQAMKSECMIEYGYSQCYEGKLYIPFYNPNQRNITFLQVSIPVKRGTNVYEVREPLYSNESKALPTINCESNIRTDPFRLMWCCEEDCFEVKMNEPSDDVRVELK